MTRQKMKKSENCCHFVSSSGRQGRLLARPSPSDRVPGCLFCKHQEALEQEKAPPKRGLKSGVSVTGASSLPPAWAATSGLAMPLGPLLPSVELCHTKEEPRFEAGLSLALAMYYEGRGEHRGPTCDKRRMGRWFRPGVYESEPAWLAGLNRAALFFGLSGNRSTIRHC